MQMPFCWFCHVVAQVKPNTHVHLLNNKPSHDNTSKPLPHPLGQLDALTDLYLGGCMFDPRVQTRIFPRDLVMK